MRPLSDTRAAALNWENESKRYRPHGAGPTDSDERELRAALARALA